MCLPDLLPTLRVVVGRAVRWICGRYCGCSRHSRQKTKKKERNSGPKHKHMGPREKLARIYLMPKSQGCRERRPNSLFSCGLLFPTHIPHIRERSGEAVQRFGGPIVRLYLAMNNLPIISLSAGCWTASVRDESPSALCAPSLVRLIGATQTEVEIRSIVERQRYVQRN
jgi:hypothetical protein